MAVFSTTRKLTLLSLTCLWMLPGIWTQILMGQPHTDVIEGQMVILKASYISAPGSDLSTHTILWNLVSNNTQLIISYTKGSINVGSAQFKGRVGFTSGMPSSDVSLYINNTQESDSGRYLCQVIIPDNPGFTADLSLDVHVPPAVPKCSLSGRVELKGNVTLNCRSSNGKPVPLYRWRKTSPTSEVFFSPMLDEKSGTLKLSNLSRNMSGKYECTASNAAGSERCFISLEAITSNNVGVIVGATVGSVVGFLCLFFFLSGLYFLLKRRRDSEDDMANEIKEDAQAPKRVSWAKSGMGSDIISKNGTLSSIASSPQHREPSNNHHHHLQHYPQRPPSDTASIITAAGSTAGYRPSRHQGASTPTHYGYNDNTTLPRGQPAPLEANTNGGAQPTPERYTQLPQAQVLPQTYSQPQHHATPPPPPLPSSVVSASNITRMGGVPIMVPAQNQAGSLV
uniref:endothelial cell adhesion molecule a n=1 Tax=Doryrhamphus excisus TaxID=161450 RepID=UPI0025AE5E34|nr:endothelial cell adhesion molecule a [Doryrhamphus excisus]